MSRVAEWLRDRCGRHWPAVVKGADGAATTFAVVFAGYLGAHGVTAEHLGPAGTWHAAAAAAGFAALNVAKSAVMVAVTGQTALGGLVSNQLRAQRDLRPVKHPVPLRKPRRARTPRRPAGARRGLHEAPADKDRR